MCAQKVSRRAVKRILMHLCLTLIVVVNLSCSLTGIEQGNSTSAEFNGNGTVLTIVDISDIRNPRIRSSIHLPSLSNKNNNVVVYEGFSYAATSDGLHIIDSATPQKLKIVASVELPGVINQVRLSQNYLYVGSDQGLHTVDVSDPNQPVIMRTSDPEAYENMPIQDIQLHTSYAYVIDKNDYLHVLDLSAPANPRLIRSETVRDYWLLGVRADGPKVQIIQLPNSPSFSPEIWEELLNRKNLLEFRGWFDKMRVSEDHLAFVDSRSWLSIAFARRSRLPMGGEFQYFHPASSYLAHLYLSEKRKIDARTPTHAAVLPQSILLMAQDKWSHTVSVPQNLLGRITDMQFLGNVLCMTGSSGVFLIADVGDDKNRKVLSAVDLSPHQPMSFAIDDGYAVVIGADRS